MKKCRITVLKTHFDEELANEYGVKGLGKCPFHTVGQVYSADMQSLTASAMKRGKPFISMFLPCHMAVKCSITATGLRNWV